MKSITIVCLIVLCLGVCFASKVNVSAGQSHSWGNVDDYKSFGFITLSGQAYVPGSNLSQSIEFPSVCNSFFEY